MPSNSQTMMSAPLSSNSLIFRTISFSYAIARLWPLGDVLRPLDADLGLRCRTAHAAGHERPVAGVGLDRVRCPTVRVLDSRRGCRHPRPHLRRILDQTAIDDAHQDALAVPAVRPATDPAIHRRYRADRLARHLRRLCRWARMTVVAQRERVVRRRHSHPEQLVQPRPVRSASTVRIVIVVLAVTTRAGRFLRRRTSRAAVLGPLGRSFRSARTVRSHRRSRRTVRWRRPRE